MAQRVSHFSTATGTQTESFVLDCSRWKGKSSGPSRAGGAGDALEFEAVKTQIKALRSTYTSGTQAGLCEDCLAGSPLPSTPLGSGIGKRRAELILCEGI